MFRLAVKDNPPKTSAQVSAAQIAATTLMAFVEDIIIVASKLSITAGSAVNQEEVNLQPALNKAAACLAESLMHDVHFPGNKSRKVNIWLHPNC